MRFRFSLAQHPKGDLTRASDRRLKSVTGLIAGVLVVTTATVAAFRPRRATPGPKVIAPSVNEQTRAIPGGADRAVEALPIQLKPLGFVPREITRSPGDYIFSVGNQSGVPEINLSLDREHGRKLQNARIMKERLRWRQKVSLTPGIYLITEANHPDWVCRIEIK